MSAPTDIGSKPAFPQHPCQMCKGSGALGATLSNEYRECKVCHGTGLVGGGLTVREWMVGQALAQLHLVQHGDDRWGSPDLSSVCVGIADALLAALEAK